MDNYCISIIEKKFNSKSPKTYIVDVHTNTEMSEIIAYFSVGSTTIISASDYCKNDELPRLDNLYNVVSHKSGNILVTELSSFVRFNGEYELRSQLSNMLNLVTTGVVVFLTFCCAELLTSPDPRTKERIYISGETTRKFPEIILANHELPFPDDARIINGIHSIATVIETECNDKLYVLSQKRSSSYLAALYNIKDLSSAYDMLCQKDTLTHSFDSSIGTEKQWSYALSFFNDNSCWEEVVSFIFGSFKNLEFALPNYDNFDSNKKWLYFLALKMFKTSGNVYLNMVIECSTCQEEFIKKIYRVLLDIEETDVNFSKYYTERKNILKYFIRYNEEAEDFCKMAKLKSEKEIYYLTDLTLIERESVFEFLDRYGVKIERKKLETILSEIYPDLSDYLAPYHFKIDLLDNYFQQYKYQKLVNKILPEFETLVEEQAEKRDFTLFLEPRTSKFDSIDKSNSQLYFIDAMGVEYLGYILSKCNQKELEARVSVCYCELPSLTCFNKEFVSVYEEIGLPVVSVKDIDEIKHRGKYDYNYELSKLPLHLIKELSVIDETLDRIRTKLIKEECSKVIMVSDHGASRLAVITEKENKWKMSSNGIHSGRCCPKTEIESKPSCSTEERDFWVLANYDRFKGGRKANVEVHGGATLEEVVVPIIEFSIKNTNIEIHIVEPIVTVSFRKKATITLFSKTKLTDVSIYINGKYYDTVSNDDNFYTFEMPDIKKKGEYAADVYSNGNLLISNLSFTVEKEGTQENKLF